MVLVGLKPRSPYFAIVPWNFSFFYELSLKPTFVFSIPFFLLSLISLTVRFISEKLWSEWNICTSSTERSICWIFKFSARVSLRLLFWRHIISVLFVSATNRAIVVGVDSEFWVMIRVVWDRTAHQHVHCCPRTVRAISSLKFVLPWIISILKV